MLKAKPSGSSCPPLAKANGVDFDECGITVCSVAGTNFLPYIQLFGERGLCLPVAVVTDGDPADDGTKRGEKRVIKLLQDVISGDELAGQTQLLEIARERGFFVGEQTCEIDLLRSGAHDEIGQTLAELAPGDAARTRAQAWQADPGTVDPVRLLKDITVIGKGRFAQRLSTRLTAGRWPAYMRDAVAYVRTRCR